MIDLRQHELLLKRWHSAGHRYCHRQGTSSTLRWTAQAALCEGATVLKKLQYNMVKGHMMQHAHCTNLKGYLPWFGKCGLLNAIALNGPR
jgi:hypothetical protein